MQMQFVVKADGGTSSRADRRGGGGGGGGGTTRGCSPPLSLSNAGMPMDTPLVYVTTC